MSITIDNKLSYLPVAPVLISLNNDDFEAVLKERKIYEKSTHYCNLTDDKAENIKR